MYDDRELKIIISHASELQASYYTETEVMQILEDLRIDPIRAQEAIDSVEERNLNKLAEESRIRDLILRIVNAGAISVILFLMFTIGLSVWDKLTSPLVEQEELQHLELELRLEHAED